MDYSEPRTVVIDSGSSTVRAGFAGEDEPSCSFPNIVGRLKDKALAGLAGMKEFYVGNEAQSKAGLLDIKYPIEHGHVVNWENMKSVWHHTFFEALKVDPCELRVLISEITQGPKASREKTVEIMFEEFNVASLSVAHHAVLALAAAGRKDGLVLDCGHGITHSVPVIDGYVLYHGIQTLHLGGKDITDRLISLLEGNGHVFGSLAEKLIVEDIKKNLCFVALDFERAMHDSHANKDNEKNYDLPDGRVITLNSERFSAPEILFDPSLVGNESCPIGEMTYNSIIRCDVDYRQRFYHNIVLSGGTTMLPLFGERIKKEVTAHAPGSMNVTVVALPKRDELVWRGGSIFALDPEQQHRWIEKIEYDNSGPNVVHRKCF